MSKHKNAEPTVTKRITYTEWLFLRKAHLVGGKALESATFRTLIGKGLITDDAKVTEAGKKALSNGYGSLPKGVHTESHDSFDASGAAVLDAEGNRV